MPQKSKIRGVASALSLLLALMSLTPVLAQAKAGEAIPDTTKMSPLQLMAWRAQFYKKDAGEPAAEPPLPEGVTRLTVDAGHERYPVWSPDGRFVYYGRSTGSSRCINRIDIATRETVAVTDSTHFAKMPDISPDGRHMSVCLKVMGLGTKVWVIRLEDGVMGKLTPDNDESRETWSRWSRDGMNIFYLTEDLNPLMATPSVIGRMGENARPLFEAQNTVSRPAVSRAGDRIAWTMRDELSSIVRLVNTSISAIYEDVIIPGYHISSADWLPGDTKMVVSYLDESDPEAGFRLGLLDLDLRQLTPLVDLDGTASEPRVSPDGTQVVFQAQYGGNETDLFLLDL